MTSTELEQSLTTFLQIARAANARYEQAVAEEKRPNEAIQDLLHQAEFAPSQLANFPLVETLHELREYRREAKKELEVTELFKAWSDEAKISINKLENAIGQMRKVIRRQPNAFYMYKTDILNPKATPLILDASPPKPEVWIQIELKF